WTAFRSGSTRSNSLLVSVVPVCSRGRTVIACSGVREGRPERGARAGSGQAGGLRAEEYSERVAPRTFRVPPDLAGERLDRVVTAFFEGELSRARVQEWIRDGGVHIGGRVELRPSTTVEAGQEIELVDVPRSRVRAGGPAEGELAIVFEDAHIAVIDKPAGQLTHPTSVVVGGTVSELAVARYGTLPAPQGAD